MSRFIFTISLVLLLFGGVTAGTIKVPTDYATIQAGIDAAVNGDTVLVAAGTYYENINFKGKAITAASYFLVDGDTTHINSTIIDGSRPSDPNKGSVVSFTSGEDTTSVICGFTITGGTGTIYDAETRVGGGIYCKNSGARISHNKIVDNKINHNYACDGGGIGYWPHINSSARYVIIEDNVIESNSITSSNGSSYIQGGGICVIKGRITGNTIRYNSVGGQPIFAGGGGISAFCEDTATRTMVVITGNTITHNQAITSGYYGGWGAGVDVCMCNVQILDNTIAHNQAGGRHGKGAGIRLWKSKAISIIKNNTISFNSATMPGAGGGIELDQTEGVQVVGNRIEGNSCSLGGGGIDESRCTLAGNLINGNFIKSNIGGQQGGGIWAMNAKIINNVIVENEAGRGGAIYYYYHPSFGSKVAQIINNTLTKNVADTAGSIAIYRANAVVMNTISWGNKAPHGPEIELWGGTLNAAHSDISFGSKGIAIDSTATVNWLAGNIDANPLFTFSDYQLSNSSPCIGAGIESLQIGGTTYYCPNIDFAGNPRPNPAGSMPDLGAYENPLDAHIGPIRVPEQYASIQAGIDAASDGNMVLVADGTYFENINFKGKAITVASHYLMDGDTTHINNTIIDGSQPSHADSGSVVFFVSGEDTTSVLCGFTITKGSGTEISYLYDGSQYYERAGGGILCFKAGARIVNNKIIENAVYSVDKEVHGGGVTAYLPGNKAFVIIEDNQISHNNVTADQERAYSAGLNLWCNAILRNNQIDHNTVVANATPLEAFAGGLTCYSDSLEDCREVIIESNTISHNSVTSKNSNAEAAGCLFQGEFRGRFAKNEVSYNELWAKTDENAIGAGIWIIEAANSFVLEDNIIRENAVKQGYGHGGGIAIGWNSSLSVINNIIEGNSATKGGGFFIYINSSPQIINNTIIDNKASEYGGGITVRRSGSTVLMNNIIWNNQAPTYAAIYIEEGTVQAAYCDIQGGWSGTGNINADPLFADTLFHLSDNSPCIGKGIASLDFGSVTCCCPTTDLAGNLRPNPAGSNPDIGAYESPLATEVMNFAKTEIPQNYFLSQNYPNPFNPSTTIEFALPKSAFVTLKVYNLLGEEVATLIAEQRSAGIHKLKWDASGLASGVYLYRLEAGSFTQTKKLILIR
jgi:parallel beta-helix repeat protein